MEGSEGSRQKLASLVTILHTVYEKELTETYNMVLGIYSEVNNVHGETVVSSVELSEIYIDLVEARVEFSAQDAVYMTEVDTMSVEELKAYILLLNELKARVKSLTVNFMDIYHNLKREEVFRLAQQNDMLVFEYDYLIVRYRMFFHRDPLAAVFWKLCNEIWNFVAEQNLNAPHPEKVFSPDYGNHRNTILHLQTNIATFKLFEQGVIDVETVRKMWIPFGPSLDDMLNPLCIQFHDVEPMQLAPEESPKPGTKPAKKAKFPSKATIVDLPLGIEIEEGELKEKLLYLSPNMRREVRNVLATRTHIQRILGVLKDKKVKRLSPRGHFYRGRGGPMAVGQPRHPPTPPPPTGAAAKSLKEFQERRRAVLNQRRAVEAQRIPRRFFRPRGGRVRRRIITAPPILNRVVKQPRVKRRPAARRPTRVSPRKPFRARPAIIPPRPPPITHRAGKTLDEFLKTRKGILDQQKATAAKRILQAARRGKAKPAVIPPPPPPPTDRAGKTLDEFLKTRKGILDQQKAAETKRIQQAARRGKAKPAVIPPPPPAPTERAGKTLQKLLETRKYIIDKQKSQIIQPTSRRGKAKPAVIPPPPPPLTERAGKTLQKLLETRKDILDKQKSQRIQQTSRRGKSRPAVIPPPPPPPTTRAEKTLQKLLETRKNLLDKRKSQIIQQTSRRGKSRPAVIPPPPPPPTTRAAKTLQKLLETRKDILGKKKASEDQRIQQTSRRGKARPAFILPPPPPPTTRAERTLQKLLETRKDILEKQKTIEVQRTKQTARRGKARPAVIPPTPPQPTARAVNALKTFRIRRNKVLGQIRAADNYRIKQASRRGKARPAFIPPAPPQPTRGAIKALKDFQDRRAKILDQMRAADAQRMKQTARRGKPRPAVIPTTPPPLTEHAGKTLRDFLETRKDILDKRRGIIDNRPKPKQTRTREPPITHLFSNARSRQHRLPNTNLRPALQTPSVRQTPWSSRTRSRPRTSRRFTRVVIPETPPKGPDDRERLHEHLRYYSPNELSALGFSPGTIAAIEAAKSPRQVGPRGRPGDVDPSTLSMLGYSPRTIAAIQAAQDPDEEGLLGIAAGYTVSPRTKAAIEAASSPYEITEDLLGIATGGVTVSPGTEMAIEAAPSFRDQDQQFELYRRPLGKQRYITEPEPSSTPDMGTLQLVPARKSPRRKGGTFVAPPPLTANALATYKSIFKEPSPVNSGESKSAYGSGEAALNEREMALYEQMHEADEGDGGVTINLDMKGEFEGETSTSSSIRRSPGASPY